MKQILSCVEIFYKIAKETDKKRGFVAVESDHPLNESNKDKFPINKASEGKKAIMRVLDMNDAPTWWKGSLSELQKLVIDAVKSKFKVVEHNDIWIVKEKN